MPQYSHLHPSVIKQMELSPSERINWMMKPRWLGYPRAKEVLDKLEDLLVYPRQERMPNMALIGKSNNGKTKLVKHFAQQHLPEENTGGESIIAPVLYCQAPPNPNESSFYSSILSSMYERVPTSSTHAQRTRLIEVLSAVQLKVLIIDELHNILAGSSVKQQQFLNMIKYLSNELQISIVGCGTADLLNAMSTDPQIQNRFTPEILPTWKPGSSFRQLLKSFECTLPLHKPSNLHEQQVSSKILAMSEGTIGEVSTLLNLAAKWAIHKNLECIDVSVLNNCGYTSPDDRNKVAMMI